MKLHVDKDHKDYHPIVPYVKVFIDCGRTELRNCVSFDTLTGDYEYYEYPLVFTDDTNEVKISKGNSGSLNFEVHNAPMELVESWYKKEIPKGAHKLTERFIKKEYK